MRKTPYPPGICGGWWACVGFEVNVCTTNRSIDRPALHCCLSSSYLGLGLGLKEVRLPRLQPPSHHKIENGTGLLRDGRREAWVGVCEPRIRYTRGDAWTHRRRRTHPKVHDVEGVLDVRCVEERGPLGQAPRAGRVQAVLLLLCVRFWGKDHGCERQPVQAKHSTTPWCNAMEPAVAVALTWTRSW